MPEDKDNKQVQQQQAAKAPVETKTDFFDSRLYGKIPKKHADIALQHPDKEFKLKDKDEYWNDENVQKIFKEQYGDQAADEFEKIYNGIAVDYQMYSMGQYDKADTEEWMQSEDAPSTPGIGERDYFDMKQVYRLKTKSHAQQLGNIFTEQKKDVRAVNIDAKEFVGLDGEVYDMKQDESMDSGWSINGVDANEFENKDGKKYMGTFYDPETMDPYSRADDSHLLVAFEGEYAKAASLQQVSHWDLTGTTTPHLKSGGMDKALAIPKGIFGAGAGIIQGVNALGSTVSHVIGADGAKEWFENNEMTYASVAFSKTQEANEDFTSMENLGFLSGDVLTQLGSGVGAGRLAGSLSSKLLGLTNVANKTKKVARISKITSQGIMTIGAVKDSRRSALANGFTENEAAGLYGINLLAMYQAQRLAGYVDDAFESTQLLKKFGGYLDDTVPYAARKMEEEAAKGVLKEGANRMTDEVKSNLFKTMTKKLSGGIKKIKALRPPGEMTEAMTQEAFEESAEFIGEELVKQAANAYVASGLAGREYGEEGKGRFKDIFDKGYWKEFGEGISMSALTGAAGGAFSKSAMGKKLFFYGKLKQKDIDRSKSALSRGWQGLTSWTYAKESNTTYDSALLNAVLDGKGEEWVEMLTKAREDGKLGSKELSIDFDEKGEFFKPFKEGDGRQGINMNDGNYEIHMQQYNYVQSVVDGLGVRGDVKALLDENPELAKNLENHALVRDVKDLVNDYFELSATNDDLALKEIKVPKDDLTPNEREKFIKGEIDRSNMSREDVEAAIEIKERLNKMHNGEAAAKYHMEAMLKGTELDPEHPDYEENYGKYGPDFLPNMMRASHKSAKDRKKLADDIAIKMESNTKSLNDLDKSLSNIDDVLNDIRSDDELFLTDKSKEKIQKLVDNYKVPTEEMSAVKKGIEEKVERRGLYDLKSLKENEDVRKMYEANPDIKEQLDAFLPAYYNTRLQEQLKRAETLSDLSSFKVEQPSNLINAINNSANDQVEQLAFNFLQGKLKDMTPEEASKLAEKIGALNGEKPNLHDFASKNKSLEEFEPGVFDIIQTANDNYNKLVELNKEAANKQESDYAYDKSNTDFLLQGFMGDEKGLSDADDIQTLVDDLNSQFKNGILPSGKNTFNNLEEVESILTQVNARIGQIDALNKLSNGLAQLKARQKRYDKKPSDSKPEDLGKEVSENEVEENSRIFNETLFNPELLAQLTEKNPKTLTTDEKAMLAEIFAVQGSLTQNKKTLEEHKDRLTYLQKEAIKNREVSRAEKIHMEMLVKVTKDNMELMHDFLSMEEVDQQDPLVQEFLNYYITKYSKDKTDTDSLKDDFRAVYAMKVGLYGMDGDKKTDLLEAFDKYLRGDKALVGENAAKFTKMAIAMEFDIEEFYSQYKGLLSNKIVEEMPTAVQEEVAIATAAHMTTDVSNKIAKYIDIQHQTKGLLNMMFVSGVGGSGKSTMVAGVGAKIGQAMIRDKYPKIAPKVLLAANHQDQVNILSNTANQEKFDIPTKRIGSRRGVVLEDLIDALEQNRDFDDVSTIIYDEATFIRYSLDNNTRHYDEKSDLAKIEDKILAINEIRKKKSLPKLKIVLMGDPGQNGKTNEDTGVKENISKDEQKILTTERLTFSHRSSVSPLLGALEKILRPENTGYYLTGPNSLNNIETNYGKIQGLGSGRMGGVQFTTIFDNDELLDNVEAQIKAAKSSDKDFTVAIVTTDEIPDSRLSEMMKSQEYKDNFKVFTHEGVQGQEFDYVLATVNAGDIGHSKLDWKVGKQTNPRKEEAAANKLATTISRARYFVAIDNRTERNFKSKEIDTITLPIESDLKEIAEKMRNLMLDFIPTEGITPQKSEDIEEDLEETTEEETVEETTDNTEDDFVEEEEVVEEIIEDDPDLVEPEYSDETVESDTDRTMDDDAVEELNEKKKLDKAKAIEDIRSSVKGEIDTVENLEKGLEEAVENNDASKVKDINDKLLVAEYDARKKPTNGNLDKEEELALDDITDNIVDASNDGAKEVMERLEEEEGIVAGYSHVVDGDIAGHAVDVERLSMAYDSNEIADEDEAMNIKLGAMGLIEGVKRSNFKFEVVAFNNPKNANWPPHIMVTATNKSGKVVNLGSAMSGLLSQNTEGGALVSAAKDKIRKAENGVAKFEITNINDVIEGVSNGRLNRGKATTLKEFRKKKFPGVTFSKRIFVTTNKSSQHRGESFIFYTYNNKDFDLTDSDALLSAVPEMFSTDEARSGFKNGLGYIRLDAKPRNFSQLFKMFDSYQGKKARSLSETVNTNKGQHRILNAFAEIASVLQTNRKKLLNKDATSNELIEQILSEKEYQQFDSRGPIFSILKGLTSTKGEREVLQKIDDLLELFFTKEFLGNHSFDKDTQAIRVGKYKKTGEAFPYAVKEDFVFTYLPKTSLGEEYAKNGVSNAKFNLMAFFEEVEANTQDNPGQFDRILSVFDELLTKSNSYGKKDGGMYMRPQSVKQTPNNKYFDQLKPVLDLEDSYSINVDGITTPMVYLNANELASVFESEGDLVAKMEDVVNTVDPETVIKETAIEVESSALSAEVIDQTSVIMTTDYPTKRAAKKAIHAAEDIIAEMKEKAETITDPAIKKSLNEKVARLTKDLKDAAENAYKNVGKKPTITQTTQSAVDNAINKAEEVIDSMSEEDSIQLQNLKEDLNALVDDFKISSQFIFDPKSLNDFKQQLKEVTSTTDAEIAQELDLGSMSLTKVNELNTAMKMSLKALQNQALPSKKDFGKAVKENMKKTFTMEEMNNLYPDAAELFDQGEGNMGLVGLLAAYHMMKDVEANTTEVEDRINELINYGSETVDTDLDIVANFPISTMEELTSRMKLVNQMYKDGDISKTKRDAFAKKLASKASEVKTVEKILSKAEIKKGESITSDMIIKDKLSMVDDEFIGDLVDEAKSTKIIKVHGTSERGTSVDVKIVTKDKSEVVTLFLQPNKITPEDIAEIKDGDIKVLLTDSFEENIEDELSPEAKEVIERTWAPLQKFVSLKVEAQHIQDNIMRDFKDTVEKVEVQTEFLGRFIMDPDKRAVMKDELNSRIESIEAMIEENQNEFTEAKGEIEATTIASKENLTPTFNNPDLQVNLTAEAKQALESLDDSAKNTLVEYLNNNLGSDLNPFTKMMDQIEENVSEEVLEEIDEYLENKLQDTICGKR